MKPFAQYLTESTKTFDYRIKIVGDVPGPFMKDFKEKLKQFDPITISDPKTTPVLSKPAGFPAFTNERVHMIDVCFRYPATPQQIQEMAKVLGLDPNRLAVVQRDWANSMDKELLGIESQNSPDVLTKALPPTDADQKKLKKEYASGNQQLVLQNADTAKWTVAGGKTPPAVTTNQLPQGVKSPMTAVKRPPKPETGFKQQGTSR
jgi:hypothetical protein